VPQLEVHVDHDEVIQLQPSGRMQLFKPLGASPGQSVCCIPGHHTWRVWFPPPHAGHSDQLDVRHMQPMLSSQICDCVGCWSDLQSASTPLTQLTVRVCAPCPHVELQSDHAEDIQEQLAP